MILRVRQYAQTKNNKYKYKYNALLLIMQSHVIKITNQRTLIKCDAKNHNIYKMTLFFLYFNNSVY